jgi:hypothetical protein
LHQFRKDFVRLSDQKITQQNIRNKKGHVIHLILFSCFQCVVSIEACTGALPSWKRYSSVGKWRAITGHKYVSKILIYFRELILPSAMKHRWWLIQAIVYIIMCGDVLMKFGDLNVSDFVVSCLARNYSLCSLFPPISVFCAFSHNVKSSCHRGHQFLLVDHFVVHFHNFHDD